MASLVFLGIFGSFSLWMLTSGATVAEAAGPLIGAGVSLLVVAYNLMEKYRERYTEPTRAESFRNFDVRLPKYGKEHEKWFREMQKMLTYQTPVEKIIEYVSKSGQFTGWSFYLQETLDRRPERKDGRYCGICGTRKPNSGMRYCETCERELKIARAQTTNYLNMDGEAEFSETVWVRKMVVLIDHDGGIISDGQKQREMDLIDAFMAQKVTLEKADRKYKRIMQRRQEEEEEVRRAAAEMQKQQDEQTRERVSRLAKELK